jgi:hypothetical protein
MLSTQIVAGALLVGVLILTGIIFLIVDSERLGNPLKMLTLIASVTAAAMFGLSVVAPGMFASGTPASVETDESDRQAAIKTAANAIFVETLIRFFLIEAAIFLNLMVFFIEPHYASLVVVGIGVLLMLIFFPRQSKMAAAVEDQLR